MAATAQPYGRQSGPGRRTEPTRHMAVATKDHRNLSPHVQLIERIAIFDGRQPTQGPHSLRSNNMISLLSSQSRG